MVGLKIRQKRKEIHLTIAQLAQIANISESYISQLERGIIDPSVSVLRKLATALQVPVTSFFDEEYEEPILVRVKNRVTYEKEGMYLSWISVQTEKIGMVEFTLSPNCSFVPENFEQDVCIFVSEGELRIHLKEEEILLNTQDSIFISKQAKFSLYNPSQNSTKGIISVSKGSD